MLYILEEDGLSNNKTNYTLLKSGQQSLLQGLNIDYVDFQFAACFFLSIIFCFAFVDI